MKESRIKRVLWLLEFVTIGHKGVKNIGVNFSTTTIAGLPEFTGLFLVTITL
jgi:hypothetical protein